MSGKGDHNHRAPDHVARYLRRLSRWAPRGSRHDLVMEAERHLYEATRRAEDDGLSHEMAQRAAVRAFGPAWRIGLAARGLDENPLFVVSRGVAMALTLPVRALRLSRGPRWRRRPRPRLF